MNHTHAITGGVAAMAVYPVLPHGVQPTGAAVLAYLGVAFGAATLPDIDHHESTPTNYLPPLTILLSLVLGPLSGGHRHAMHWLWMAPVVAGAVALAPWWGGPVAVWAVATLLAGLGSWAVRLAGRLESLAGAALVSAVAVAGDLGSRGWWLVPAVLLGYAAHTVGDLVYGGCFVGPGQFVQFAELETGGLTEVGFTRPLSWVALGLCCVAAAVGWGPVGHAAGSLVGALHQFWVSA